MYKSLNDDDSQFGLNDKYKAILEVDKKLTEEGIPHELLRLIDGWKIAYPNQDDCRFDVIEHKYSYGHNEDLMEAMGEDLDDYVEGHCDVERAMELFRKIHSVHEA